jgi:hypothetical protein
MNTLKGISKLPHQRYMYSILDHVNQKLNVPGIADFHQELRNLLRPR